MVGPPTEHTGSLMLLLLGKLLAYQGHCKANKIDITNLILALEQCCEGRCLHNYSGANRNRGANGAENRYKNSQQRLEFKSVSLHFHFCINTAALGDTGMQ